MAVQLEAAAQSLADATSTPPYLFDLGVDEGRSALAELQERAGAELEEHTDAEPSAVETGELVVAFEGGNDVPVRVVTPRLASTTLPVILYLHGGGWVFGDWRTHARLARQLALDCAAAVVLPSYSRAPEARYPRAIEECATVARWILEQGVEHGLDPERLAVTGDDVGANLAIALCLRDDLRSRFSQQVLFCPVTDARFDTSSYREFATGYFLRQDAMRWFWDQYTTSPTQRAEISASPLRATPAQLTGMPPTLVITAEADVVRDEGEAFAAKLRRAGVAVVAARFQGAIHDFVVLDALAATAAARAAVALAAATLRQALSSQPPR